MVLQINAPNNRSRFYNLCSIKILDSESFRSNLRGFYSAVFCGDLCLYVDRFHCAFLGNASYKSRSDDPPRNVFRHCRSKWGFVFVRSSYFPFENPFAIWVIKQHSIRFLNLIRFLATSFIGGYPTVFRTRPYINRNSSCHLPISFQLYYVRLSQPIGRERWS